MGSLYENITSLCDRAGINITEMCRRAGVPRGNLTDLKMGRQASLSTKNLEKIAACFNVSVGSLLDAGRSPDELELAVRALPGYGDYDPTRETVPEYLVRKAKDAPPAPGGKRDVDDEDIKFALFGGEGEITDEMYEEVRQFARFLRSKHRSP